MAASEETERLKNVIANLESQVDHMQSEIAYVHRLLLLIGFPDGVQGLKETIEDLLSSEQNYPLDPPTEF